MGWRLTTASPPTRSSTEWRGARSRLFPSRGPRGNRHRTSSSGSSMGAQVPRTLGLRINRSDFAFVFSRPSSTLVATLTPEGWSTSAAECGWAWGVRMPRTPAVYPRKRKWRLRSDDAVAFGDELEGMDAWRINYKTAVLHKEEIHRQLIDHHHRGLSLKLSPSEAFDVSSLSINSLGGVEKTHDDGRPPPVRVVMDATHGVRLNRAVRQLDRDRVPTALDVKRLQREQSLTGPALGLAVDAQEAHRLVAVHPSDWPLQGCRSDVTGEVFLYKVGCFGVTTAAYWWSRLGGPTSISASHPSSH